MREIFTEIFENQPLDPTEAAQRAMRPHLRQRFYKQAHTGDTGDASVAILLDGKPVLTPARRALAAPSHALAGAIAGSNHGARHQQERGVRALRLRHRA